MPKQSPTQYEVEKVLNTRIEDGRKKYQVLWKGYYQHQATWQPEECLKSSKKLIKIFEKEQRLKGKKIINQKAVQQNQKQLRETEYKLIKNYKELQQLLSSTKPNFHNPIPFVKMGKPSQPITTFECLLSKTPNQMIKVQRYDQIQGCWKQKLETCSSVIAKAATIQRKELVLSEQRIEINGISTLNKQYFVHFQFRQRRYKCQLKILRLLKPHQIIQFLLQRYDPADNKTKTSKEIFQYLKKHPKTNADCFD